MSARYAWMDAALCAQTDPDQWTSAGSQTVPKRICADCPVRPECDAHATALHIYDGLAMNGVWGGRSKRQRDEDRQQAA
jgi:WhiB family transcriptional regulator, redox-sensing transcriptional regulator